MAERIRLGFVGVGAMGQAAHLHNYITLGGCEVTAIAEVRADLREGVAKKWGIKATYANAEQMLERESLDAIVAIQPFSNHSSLVPNLASSKLPILIEKPLSDSLEAGRNLLTAIQKAGSEVWLAYHKRSDLAIEWTIQKMAELKQSGEVGKLKYVRITMPPGDWARDMFRWNAWSSEPAPGGGVSNSFVTFVNYYIHQVNLLRHLLGEDYQVTFADRGGVLLAAEGGSGTSGLIEMSPYSTDFDWEEMAFIAFEKAWIEVRLPAPGAINLPGSVRYRDAKGVFSPVFEPKSAMHRQAENFLSAVQGKQHPLASAETGMKDLETASEYLTKMEEN